jgi:transposase
MDHRKRNPVRFENQDFWIGLDVAKHSWKVTIRSLGLELKTMVTPPDPQVLHDYLVRNYPGGRYHTVYEAGFSGFWAHRELQRLGIDNRVVHPADVPTSDKERRQKDDVRDSRKLATGLAAGELKGIYIPTPELEELRSLCRLRERSSSHLRRLKARIKGLLMYYGLQLTEDAAYRHWSGVFLARLAKLCEPPGPRADCLALSLEALREEGRRQAEILRRLRGYCRHGDAARIIRLLRTIPGIGPTTAFVIYTELQDIARFQNLDRLYALVGLIPSTASTGDRHHATGITPRRHRRLRPVLIEAAWVAVKRDPVLLRDFARLAGRMKKPAAIVRIARKLTARVAYVWRTGTPYQPASPAA